jgi:hypothetical protein
MKDLIDIIADTLSHRSSHERDDILLLVENLYFNDVRRPKWRKLLSPRETTLIAEDIMNLQNSVEKFNSIKGVNVKSKLIRAVVNNISTDGESRGIESLQTLTKGQRDFFEVEVIKRHRKYVTAVMLAELIRDEKRRIRNNQWLTYLIPILTALIAASAVILNRRWR